MQISSLLRRDAVSIPASATLRDAAARMREDHVGALVVTDAATEGSLLGVLTDRDLVVQGLAQGLEPTASVRMLCSQPPLSVAAESGLDEAIAAMRQAGVRRVLVRGTGGMLLGVVSIDDLVEALAGELQGLAAALRTGVDREIGRETDDGQAAASLAAVAA